MVTARYDATVAMPASAAGSQLDDLAAQLAARRDALRARIAEARTQLAELEADEHRVAAALAQLRGEPLPARPIRVRRSSALPMHERVEQLRALLKQGAKTREEICAALDISAPRSVAILKPLIESGEVRAVADPASNRGRQLFSLA